MSTVKIRRPKHEDVDELHDLFRIVVKDTFRREGFEDLVDQMNEIIEEKKKYLKEDLSTNGKARYFLIAEQDGIILGSIESGPASKLLIESTNDSYSNAVELGTIFILPIYQKCGIGTQLISAMCKKLASENIKEICIQSGYKVAGKVWKKKLGRPLYILPEYWGENYDHLVWCNELSESGDIIYRG